jgi:hypothetical protein
MPDPSTGMEYPNRPEELKNVEMKPVVIGPGAYSSPDPSTESGRLLPLHEHPLAEQMSEDYGQDVANADTGPEPSEEEAALNEMTVEELDDTYGDYEGYPSSGKKSEKVAFASAVEKES